MSIGIYTTFPHSKNNELQKRQAPSLVGEDWGEESKIKYLHSPHPSLLPLEKEQQDLCRYLCAMSYRYLHKSSSRQGEQSEGWPRSRSHGWQNQTYKLFFLVTWIFLELFSHPCVLDSGNPCRNDGNVTCVATYPLSAISPHF
jgi:hypothetical protein